MTNLEWLMEDRSIVFKWLENGNQAMCHFKERKEIDQYQARMYKEAIEWVEELLLKYERLSNEIEAEIRGICKEVNNGKFKG